MRPLDSGLGRVCTRGAEVNFRPGARRGPPEMACSREPTSRMYAALENGIVVQVVAMVLAGGLRRATHGIENIKCTAKRESAKSLSSELERSHSPSDLVVAGFKVVGGHHPTTLRQHGRALTRLICRQLDDM